MNFRISYKAALAAYILVSIPIAANAAFISAGSQFNISGFNQAVLENPGDTLDQAIGLDFTDGTGTPSPGTAGEITAYSGFGDFLGLSCNAAPCGSIEDILDFSSFIPIASFYTTNDGVTFDLDALTSIVGTPAGPGLASLDVSGTGTFHYAGFDPTPAVFTLSTQGGNFTTFSATTVAQGVPEPLTLGLLGIGLLGLGLARGTGHSRRT